MTNRCTPQKQPRAFFFTLFLLLAIGFAALISTARADDLAKGIELYQNKQYKEAIPYLEKSAQQGNEDAIKALDQIYGDIPAAPVAKDKAPTTDKKTATAAKPSVIETPPAPQYERATVNEDEQEARDRSFMRKAFFLGTAVLILLLWAVQYFLLRKLRNNNFRRETPEETATRLKKEQKK